jgi:histidinol dehydrogenase
MAADLLAQAEHGESSQVLLVSTSPQLVTDTLSFVDEQLQQLPRKEAAAGALRNSRAIVFSTMDEATAFVNAYAPEHLIISCANEVSIAEGITNAGSVFIGAYSPESVGDYASGTNHTLPTNGFARAYSGVSVDSFVRKITFQQLSRSGLEQIASTVIEMAEAEGLRGHAEAVRVRLQ